jgi:hypothetical protein
MQAPKTAAVDDCFARLGVAELTIELAATREVPSARAERWRTTIVSRWQSRIQGSCFGDASGSRGGAAECAWPERVGEADENEVRSAVAIEAGGVG